MRRPPFQPFDASVVTTVSIGDVVKAQFQLYDMLVELNYDMLKVK